VRDRVPHGPTVCYPYQGWREELNEMIPVPSTAASFPELKVRKLVYAKGDARVAVLYWYAANGKQQVDATRQKFYAALHDLIGQGGAYVFQLMLTTPITSSPEQAFPSLERFLTENFASVAKHLP
jgi:EpsI family protein